MKLPNSNTTCADESPLFTSSKHYCVYIMHIHICTRYIHWNLGLVLELAVLTLSRDKSPEIHCVGICTKLQHATGKPLLCCTYRVLCCWLTFGYFSPRFVPDKGFAGADRSQKRDGPVQFERDDEDIFGLNEFLDAAKKGAKRPAAEDSRGSRYDRKRDRRE